MTDRELADQARAHYALTTISGVEYAKRKANGWKGKPYDPNGISEWAKGDKLLALIGTQPSSSILTGSHWVSGPDFPIIKQIGYGFAVNVVNPGNLGDLGYVCNAAATNGLKLILGLYPEPYTLNADGSWTISAGGVLSLQAMAARPEITALFVFNEPYWIGGYSAAQLRSLRTKIQSVWPAAKVYHDLGQPSRWATGDLAQGTKWLDQTGVCDYAGIWSYPFTTGGYKKTQSLADLARETAFVRDKMGATSVWLGQSHSYPGDGLVMPTLPQITDWNQACRAALPVGSMLSWYVWEQAIYPSYLKSSLGLWPGTV